MLLFLSTAQTNPHYCPFCGADKADAGKRGLCSFNFLKGSSNECCTDVGLVGSVMPGDEILSRIKAVISLEARLVMQRVPAGYSKCCKREKE